MVSRRAFLGEESRKLALPVPLQDFSTSPGTSLLEVRASPVPDFLSAPPLLNPWVRGDGVGYYALIRALLIEHNFDFTQEYQYANPSFRDQRVESQANLIPDPGKELR